jgi:O-antigen ligase
MQNLNHDPAIVADYAPKLNLWMSFVYVILGWAVALFVKADGIYSQRIQVELLGPNPLLVNDMPYLGSILLALAGAVIFSLLFAAIKSGSIDRVILGLFAFSLNADVVPMLFQLSLLSIICILVSRGLRTGAIQFRLSPMVFFAGLILLSYSVSFLQNAQPISVITNFNFRATYLFMMLLIPGIMLSHRHIETLFDFLLLAGIITVGVEVAQFGLSLATGEIITFSSTNYNRVNTPFGILPRLTGLMYHPNHQSNLIATQAVMALWLATQPKEFISRGRRAFLLLSYVILAVGVFATMSRSGWLSIAIVSVLVFFVRYRHLIPWYIIGLSIVSFVGYKTGAIEQLYQIIHDMNGDSADFRWHVDEIAMDAFFEHPWFGIGVGSFIDYYNPYQLEVHDTYLQVASGMGIFGLIAVGGCVSAIVIRLLHTVMHPADRRYKEWAIALLLGLLITSIQALFAMFLWVKFLWGMFGFSEAVILNNRDQKRHQSAKDFIFLPPPR